MKENLVNEWQEGGFKLELYDIDKVLPNYGSLRTYLKYEFYDLGELIFEGDDYGLSPLHSMDSPEAIESLLGFLSLREGDTDEEYFEAYTERQIEWRDERAEVLS